MIGTTLGSHRIVERIGDGGMGAVYRATDVMLHRDVAIKVLRPELSRQAGLVERFRDEAVALARLNHPNIATLYGLGTQGEDLYMVMEYVRGDTLERVLERSGRLAWHRAAELACRVLDALDHAHDMGVVHRDIKPANVMLARNGAVKVMDFGIARMRDRTRQTQFGRAVGTPLYMSPEQLRGEDVDGRTDLYSLGVVLYELVTGELAFQADSDYSLMMAQLHEMPAAPSTRVRDVPRAIDDIVFTAVAKSAHDRFPTAADFRDALERALRIAPATTATPSRERVAATRLADAPFEGSTAAAAAPVAVSDPALPATRLAPAAMAGMPPSTDIAETRLGAASLPETRLALDTPAAGIGATRAAEHAPARRPAPGTARTPVRGIRDWRVAAAAAMVIASTALIVRTVRSPDEPGPTTNRPADSARVVAAPDTVTTRVATDTASRTGAGAADVPRSSVPGFVLPPIRTADDAPPPPPKDDRPSRDRAESPPPKGRDTSVPAEEPVRPAPRTEVSAARQITGAVGRFIGLIQARDATVLAGLLADGDRAGEQLLALMRSVPVTADAPEVDAPSDPSDGRASVGFATQLHWRTPFGGNRSGRVRFSADVVQRAGEWTLARWRIVDAPPLK
jgi:predicted Ser/Thr protein kinase